MPACQRALRYAKSLADTAALLRDATSKKAVIYTACRRGQEGYAFSYVASPRLLPCERSSDQDRLGTLRMFERRRTWDPRREVA